MYRLTENFNMKKVKVIILLIIAIAVCAIAFNTCKSEPKGKYDNLPVETRVELELIDEMYK